MKHFLTMLVGLLWGCYIFADITLGVIHNHSDLTLTSAWSAQSPKTKIKSVTSALKLHNKSNISGSSVFDTIKLNYPLSRVSNGSLMIEAHDVHKNKYEIILSINPTVAVQFDRKKATFGRTDIVKAQCDLTDGNLCAQVVIKKAGVVVFTGSVGHDIDNDQEHVTLDLSLIESNGVYTARVAPSNQ